MTVPGFMRGPLLAILAALVAALVVLLVSLQGAEPAQAQADSGPDPKIVGGGNGVQSDDKYPFMVSLQRERGPIPTTPPGPENHFCGGTLIDPDSVLTAAHCVEGLKANEIFVVGRTVLTDLKRGYESSVDRIEIHPDFNNVFNLDRLYLRDVAVLTLSGRVRDIEPIHLADRDENGRDETGLEKPGRLLTVAGWGDTTERPGERNIPDRLRDVHVPVVSDDEAKRAYNLSPFSQIDVSVFRPLTMVAAGKKGKGFCEGDSGGPLFTEVNSGFTQVGIVSFQKTNTCAQEGLPGLFTEVNSPDIRSFIDRAKN